MRVQMRHMDPVNHGVLLPVQYECGALDVLQLVGADVAVVGEVNRVHGVDPACPVPGETLLPVYLYHRLSETLGPITDILYFCNNVK